MTSKHINLIYKIMVGLFCLALLDMPYEFYSVLRLLATSGLVLFYISSEGLREKEPYWKYVLVGLILLYNPFLPVHLGSKLIWIPINIATLWAITDFKKKLLEFRGEK